ncbi:hypothetical protein BN2476_620015 [Paraburkholderia piptadeniae]|uniref:Uncharacterized protein n=1 Tax=Paraburkholderia piptadeniae TaxID=1701573 RepID=A0A1N7SL38_9BURK|nr:hypothetical protein BN2476_620015 [Paraburkholderia piptadeniae]
MPRTPIHAAQRSRPFPPLIQQFVADLRVMAITARKAAYYRPRTYPPSDYCGIGNSVSTQAQWLSRARGTKFGTHHNYGADHDDLGVFTVDGRRRVAHRDTRAL